MCGQHENKLEGSKVFVLTEVEGENEDVRATVFTLKGKAIAAVVALYSPTSEELNDLYEDDYSVIHREYEGDVVVTIEEQTIL